MNLESRLSWVDVRDKIHGWILDSTYRPGDKLPRDTDIAEELGCARTTVHRAMQALADGGLVERRRKGGTTVRADPVTRATLDIPVIRREIEDKGRCYGYRLISQTTSTTPVSIARNFNFPGPRDMLHVRALHLADGQPFVFEDRWICQDTVPEIHSVDLRTESANEWLVRNRPYSRCDLKFFAQSARREDAELMGTAEGEALLIIERTTWIGTRPITSVRAITAPGYRLETSA